jgi:hypothetical protein
MFQYDKDEIKQNLTLRDVSLLLEEFEAEPQIEGNKIICRTICHNGIGEGSRKLYYYDNTKLFHCYSGCEEPSFDIFALVCKVINLSHIKDKEWELVDGVRFVAKYFGISGTQSTGSNFTQELEDWQILENYENYKKPKEQKRRELTFYDKDVLKYMPRPIILPWLQEGITIEVMQHCGICFDPVGCGIIIPHYDKDNNLLGIRTRTLIEEEEKYGKYRPAYLNGVLYKHPLSFNLYNLNNSKEHIKDFGVAIVFESEKSPMLYQSYFGIDNDISVAVCGFNLLSYQVELLISAGAKEIVIAFDKQYQTEGDEEWRSLVKKYYKLHEKYGAMVQISYIFDQDNLLGYKDSPIDKGAEIFMQLFKERIVIS